VTSDSIQYSHYLPTWNPEQKYAPLKPFEHLEHGLDADSNFPAIIREGVTVTHLTPTTGTEVVGLQLSSLDAAGKDQLARLVAERKVVAFREQDFADLPISKALEFGGYFGRHHIHCWLSILLVLLSRTDQFSMGPGNGNYVGKNGNP